MKTFNADIELKVRVSPGSCKARDNLQKLIPWIALSLYIHICIELRCSIKSRLESFESNAHRELCRIDPVTSKVATSELKRKLNLNNEHHPYFTSL